MSSKSDFTVTEVKAGIMVLASMLVLVAFVAAIRGCGSGGEESNRFTADFTSINGLNQGADVRFGGVKAGKVVQIGSNPEDRSEIRVVFDVLADIPVNHGSVATIDQVSLTTSKHLEISTGGKDQPLHTSGDHLASITKSGGFVDIPDINGVISRLETTLDGVITLLGVDRARASAEQTGEGVVDLARVAASLEKMLNSGTATFETLDATTAENRDGLKEIVQRLLVLEGAATELLANLNAAVEENREPINATMINFQELSSTASRQVEELTESLAITLQYLQEVSGNTSDLVEEQRPTLEQILLNLEQTTQSLREFSQTVADQPNSLVRGAKAKGRSSGGK